MLKESRGVTGCALHVLSPSKRELELAYLSGLRLPADGFRSIPAGTYPHSSELEKEGYQALGPRDERIRHLLGKAPGIAGVILFHLTPNHHPPSVLWLFTSKQPAESDFTAEELSTLRNAFTLALDALWDEGEREKGGEGEPHILKMLGDISTSSETQEILKIAAELMRDLLGGKSYIIIRKTSKTGGFTITETAGYRRGVLTGRTIPPNLIHALRSTSPSISEVSPAVLQRMGVQTSGERWINISFPLHKANILIGGVSKSMPSYILEKKADPIQRLVEQSLELARKRGYERDYIDKVRMISEMAQELLEESSLDSLIKKIFDTLSRVVYFPRGAFYLYDREANRLKMVAHKNIPAEMIPFKEETALLRHHGFIKETLMPILSGDTRKDPRLNYMEGMDYPISILCVPIVFRGKYMGDITLSSKEADFFTEEDLHLASIFSNIAAFVIENFTLREEARKEALRREIAERISSTIVREFELPRVISLALQEIKELFSLPVAAHLRYAGDSFSVREFVEEFKFFSKRSHFPRSEILKISDRGTRPVILREEEIERTPFSPVLEHGVTSLLLLPVHEDDALFGILLLGSSEPGVFSSENISWLNYISTQISIAAKKANLLNRLEETVRTLEETRDQMVQTEKFRALGQLASGVAHDFNNTLASIIGRAEILLEKLSRKDLSSKEIRESLELILKSASDGAQTVRRLQSYTRQIRREDLRPVDVNAIAEDVRQITLPQWKGEAEKSGIHYDFKIETGEVLPVMGNVSEIREAVVNLVLNALDAMPGGGELTITTGMDRGKVFISVKDSGKGIPPDIRDRIFEPFFTTKDTGTGLGLAVVKGIVDRMGGEIEFTSWEGTGTIFTLLFPPADEAKLALAKHEEETAKELEKTEIPPSVAKILVIDDQPEVLEVIVEQLKMLGYDATGLTDPAAALEECEKSEYTLIISDIGMPGISGWKFLELLREKGVKTPVVLISGWANGVSMDEVQSRGASGIISKPFRPADLKGEIERVLSRAGKPPEGRDDLGKRIGGT